MAVDNHGVPASTFRLAAFLPFKLATLSEAIHRVFAESYEETFDLTIPECRALIVIAEFGTLSPTAVGQHAAMDKVKVSRATQSLVTKGLLRQRKDPNDGRARLLRLTRKGVSTHARIVPLATKLESCLFDDLSRAELAALDRVLAKVTTRLETSDTADVN
jgi:DNA-binding MarR family transcriptional regulator